MSNSTGNMDRSAVTANGAVWDERYSTNAWPTDPNESLVDLVTKLNPGKAIDFGCGTGRNSIYLASIGWEVTGVDGSKVGLQIAKDLAAEKNLSIITELADLTQYKPKLNYYDLAVMSYIHFDKQTLKHILSMTVSSLKAGGYLYVVGHHVSDLGKTGPPNPELLYEAKDLAEIEHLKEVTLEEVKKEFDDGTFNIDVLLIGQKFID